MWLCSIVLHGAPVSVLQSVLHGWCFRLQLMVEGGHSSRPIRVLPWDISAQRDAVPGGVSEC